MFKQYFITTTLTSVPIPLIIDIWHLILHICTSVVYLVYNLHLQVTNCWNTEWSFDQLTTQMTAAQIYSYWLRKRVRELVFYICGKRKNIETPHAISFLSVFAASWISWPESRGNSFCYRMMFWNALRHKIQHRETVNENPLLGGVGKHSNLNCVVSCHMLWEFLPETSTWLQKQPSDQK